MAGAQAPPPLPAVYYGNALIVGPTGRSVPVTVGTVVTAKIAGEVRGQVTVGEEGVYGEASITARKLVVTGYQGEDNNATIEFFIGERRARQTATFKQETFERLDLEVEDDAPPVITDLEPADGSKVRTGRPTVGASLSDDLAGVETVTMKIDGSTVKAAVSENRITYTPDPALADGEHTVEVVAKDGVGNENKKSWSFIVDASGPTVSDFEPGDGSAVAERRPTIGASISDPSGLKRVTLKVDGRLAVEEALTGTDYRLAYQPTSDLTEGKHSVHLTATDVAGNVTEASWSFTVDTIGPAVSDVRPRDGSTVTTRRPTISASLSDPSGVDRATVEIKLDGRVVEARFEDGTVSYTPAAGLAEGAHYVQVTAKDTLGNQRTVTWSFTVAIPTGPPGPPPEAPPPVSPGPPPFPPAAPSGVIPLEELEVTVEDGITSVKVPSTAVESLLDEGVYDAVVEVPATRAKVTLSAGILGRLAERQGTFTVSTSVGQVTLDATALDLTEVSSTAPVTVALSQVPPDEVTQLLAQLPPEVRPAGIVVNVDVMVDENRVENFARPVRLVVPCQPGAAEGQLLVYRLRADGTLECVGGEPVRDAEGNVIGVAVELMKLSKYVTMEFRTALEDIRGHWSERDVVFMAARGVVKGVTPNSYEPERAVTRAEFCALLVRTFGIPQEMPEALTFADVPKDRWYFGIVEAAYRAGLVKGVGEGVFAPDRTISRQELAVMLHRALGLAGKPMRLEASEAERLLAAFSDATRVASWAQEGVAVGVKAGLLKGYPGGTFAPADATSRASAATVLSRLLKTAGLL